MRNTDESSLLVKFTDLIARAVLANASDSIHTTKALESHRIMSI